MYIFDFAVVLAQGFAPLPTYIYILRALFQLYSTYHRCLHRCPTGQAFREKLQKELQEYFRTASNIILTDCKNGQMDFA